MSSEKYFTEIPLYSKNSWFEPLNILYSVFTVQKIFSCFQMVKKSPCDPILIFLYLLYTYIYTHNELFFQINSLHVLHSWCSQGMQWFLKEINTWVVTYNWRTVSIPQNQRLALLVLIKAILSWSSSTYSVAPVSLSLCSYKGTRMKS